MSKLSDYLISWLRTEIAIAKAKGGVVGISGGVDSAVIAALIRMAFGKEKCTGLWMPCHSGNSSSSNSDYLDALDIASHFDIKLETVRLEDSLQSVVNSIPFSWKGGNDANIKARLRMIILYEYAKRYNYLVIGTSNLSERSMGYFTKWGDGASDIAPIANLYKNEVYELAKQLGVPQSIIDKVPSAGLWEGQTDEEEMGFSYKDIRDYLENRAVVSTDVYKKINQRISMNAHKILLSGIPRPDRSCIRDLID